MDNAFHPILLGFIDQVINPLVAILFAVGFAWFLWGVARFIWKSEDETERAQGKQNMIWGLIGMFIMVSVFAIVQLVADTIGADISDLPGEF